MKALVTGGTGFVGSHIVHALAAAGHEVRVLHRPTSRLRALAGVDFTSVIGDVTDDESLLRACEGVDWVFHAAAVADYWRADEEQLFRINVGGTRAVLAAARASGVGRVLFTSSASTIGRRRDGRPSDESVRFNLPPRRFPYAYSKAMAEDVVLEAVEQGQDVVILNPAIVLGPGDLNMISGTYVIELMHWRWLTPCTSGAAPFVDVRDVARWHVAAAEKGQRGRRYILSEGNYSHRAIYDMIAGLAGIPRSRVQVPDALLPLAAAGVDLMHKVGLPPPVDATQVRLGAANIYCDPSLAQREFGPPQYSIRQSLEDALAWYRQNGYLKTGAGTRLVMALGRRLGIEQ